MTEQNHTPEPWKNDPELGVLSLFWKSVEETDANAARIVACVNACAGINPEAVPELVNALTELELRTREFLAGELVTFPAALLPQVRKTLDKARGK